ncbi:hypothetical protein CYLTODRAFT_493158 [Cylindrobasidium torrendii FP15055 ss-10]|uniref:Uncharacterized protein n=1 Tax=Cylindrobasidium torrendii FP15055 ss-10 TaxID=1314674 RepID=A0A0D7B4E3_9AGAR|nr:hypothetical protein CYLTODRAFT_493158 [Cylindrobasidium torrendii FP15055 ss-10]
MLYRSEDISFSPIFYEGVEIRLCGDSQHPSVEDLECYGGLFAGDFGRLMDSPMNLIRVQPTVKSWIRRHDIVFVPHDTTLRGILGLYSRNSGLDVYERQRFDQMPAISNTVYTLAHGISRKLDRRLFTRHPVTGIVTEHKFPYTTLPEFQLTAHPCIVHMHANDLMDRRQDFPSSVASELAKFLMEDPFDWRDLPRSPCTSITSDTSSSSSSSDSLRKVHRPSIRTVCKRSRPLELLDANTLPGRYYSGAVKNATRESTRIVDEGRPVKKLRLSPRVMRKPLRVLTQRSCQRPAWR